MDEGTSFGATPTLRRVKPKQTHGLSVAEVEKKKGGNYIFSFGFPGSGKTTFQWMLMRYLIDHGPFVTEVKTEPDWRGIELINEWKSQWIEGRFPDPNASAESDIREINVRTKATAGRTLSFDFSFLEMSGELLQQVMPLAGSPPVLSPLLSAYLNNPRLKFCVMLMLSPDVEQNDQLFATFIAYLKKNFPELTRRMSLGVIVSKPDASLKKLQEYGAADGKTIFDEFDKEAVKAYVNKFCGQTYQIWSNLPAPEKTLLSPLHLGQIDTIEGDKRLVDPDFRHIAQIFSWMCKQFTGREPGPTWWQRLQEALAWE